MKDPETDRRTELALFRYGVIAEALHLPASEVAGALARQSEKEWSIPGSRRRRIAAQTMRDWLRRYRRLGLDGLKPKSRKSAAPRRLSPETVETLLAIRQANPDLSVRKVIARARAFGGVGDEVGLPASTVYRLFRREGLIGGRKTPPAPARDQRRFAASAACELWQSDVMHGPRIRDEAGRKRKTYLLCLLDDATRMVPHGEFRFSEDAASYLLVLREAIERRGLPQRIYCDNGSNFRSRQLSLVCARLGIVLIRATPFHPAGKGKIERFFRTVREQWLSRAPAEALEDIASLNRSFQQWLDCEYHLSPHRGLGGAMTPRDKWAATGGRVRRPPAGTDLEDLFLFETDRRVSSARTVSLNSRLYEVMDGLSGQTVTLRYDPSQPPEAPLKVVREGRPAGLARPLDQQANIKVKRGPSGCSGKAAASASDDKIKEF